MLIHLSRFQVWQNEIKLLVERLFKFYQSDILADDAQIYMQLKKDFEENYICGTGNLQMEYKSFLQTTAEVRGSQYSVIKQGIESVSWNEVKKYLYHVVSKINR